MKKNLLLIILLFCAYSLSAQWIQITNGLPDYPPTALWPFEEDVVVGTYGGGLFKTTDNGDNWVDINGNLANLNVKDIKGFSSVTTMFVATDGGPFFTYDQTDYIDCNTGGLSNTDINYFGIGDDDITDQFMIGTNGGGVYSGPDYNGPWTDISGGITGNGLIVNEVRGVSDGDEQYLLIGTNDGIYYASEENPSWVQKNNGLSGEALKVNSFTGLGTLILAATDGGLYLTYDEAETWTAVIPDEKINCVTVVMHSPTDIRTYAFGENGYYSNDWFTYLPLNMPSFTGEVTAVANNSTQMFIGITTEGKAGGSMFRKPLDDLVGIEDENISGLSNFSLEQNHPNPFSQSTNILYSLKNSDFVSLKVYDFEGREIKTMINEFQEKGNYSVIFEAENLPNGIYTYMLQIGNNLKKAKKMVLLK